MDPISLVGDATWADVSVSVDVLVGPAAAPTPPTPGPSPSPGGVGVYQFWQSKYNGGWRGSLCNLLACLSACTHAREHASLPCWYNE